MNRIYKHIAVLLTMAAGGVAQQNNLPIPSVAAQIKDEIRAIEAIMPRLATVRLLFFSWPAITDT